MNELLGVYPRYGGIKKVYAIVAGIFTYIANNQLITPPPTINRWRERLRICYDSENQYYGIIERGFLSAIRLVRVVMMPKHAVSNTLILAA